MADDALPLIQRTLRRPLRHNLRRPLTTLRPKGDSLMMRSLSAVAVYVLAFACVSVAAQVNPLKQGTPDVTGYRAVVMAEG